jgi:predicted O-methyltransferase YrrM
MIPNFDRDSQEGQLCSMERYALYSLIQKEDPDVVFEVGTWKGGGSTYFIASALHENKHGILHTCEINKEFYDHATNLYDNELKELKPYVCFHFGDSLEVYPDILRKSGMIDILFLDGKEDSDQTVREYCMFRPYMRNGAYMVCHDWKEYKMAELKKRLIADEHWKLITLMQDTTTGFSIWQREE